MTALLITAHVIACVLLIALILIQRGRGGGLVENLSGVESMFGTKTNAFLARTTTVLSVVFFVTCLSLALLSVRQNKSLIREDKPKAQTPAAQQPAGPVSDSTAQPAATQPVQEAPKAE